MTPLALVSEDDVQDQRTHVPTLPACSGILDGPDLFARWRGHTVAIKYGGSAMERPDLRAAFARDVVRLHAASPSPASLTSSFLAGGISVDVARVEGRRLRYDRALGALRSDIRTAFT